LSTRVFFFVLAIDLLFSPFPHLLCPFFVLLMEVRRFVRRGVFVVCLFDFIGCDGPVPVLPGSLRLDPVFLPLFFFLGVGARVALDLTSPRGLEGDFFFLFLCKFGESFALVFVRSNHFSLTLFRRPFLAAFGPQTPFYCSEVDYHSRPSAFSHCFLTFSLTTTGFSPFNVYSSGQCFFTWFFFSFFFLFGRSCPPGLLFRFFFSFHSSCTLRLQFCSERRVFPFRFPIEPPLI